MQSVKPVKTIFVASTPRTGSTYLCTVMTETGKLGKPHEYFNVNVAFPDAVSISQRYDYARKYAVTENGVISAKLYPHHWNTVCRKLDVEKCFPNIYWIWLRRKDLLAQAVSYHVAIQTKSWVSSMRPVKKPQYSAAGIHKILKTILVFNAKWQLYFVKNKLVPHLVYYEDMINNPGRVISEIGNYVNEKIEPGNIKIENHIKSQFTDLNIQWKEQYLDDIKDITNMDEVMSSGNYSLSLKNLWLLCKGKLPSP